MSDQATVVPAETGAPAPATPAGGAPAQPAQPAAPAAPAAQPDAQPRSKHEAWKGVADRARERAKQFQAGLAEADPAAPAAPAEAEAAVVPEPAIDPETGQHPQWRDGDPEGTYRDEAGKLRHATGPLKGKFAAAETGGADADEAGAGEGRSPDATPEAEAADKPRSIPVQISDDHALREMGRDVINVADEHSAQMVKALLNGRYVRRADLEAKDTKIRELQEKLVRIEANTAANQRWRSTPEYRAAVEKYEEIKELSGEEVANQWWQGEARKLQAIEQEEVQKRMQAIEQEETDRAAEAWRQEAWAHTAALPPALRALPELRQWFDEEVQILDARVVAGQLPHVRTTLDLHKEFNKALGTRLLREPKAVEALKAAKPAPKPAPPAPAAEDPRREAARRRQETPPNPLAGARSAGALERAAEPDRPAQPSDQNPHAIRKNAAASARERARSMFSR